MDGHDELDLAVAGQESDKNLRDTLWQEPLVWMASHSWRKKGDVIPLALFPAPCSFRKLTFKLLRTADQKMDVVYESSNPAGIMAAVKSGLAISLLPKSFLVPGVSLVTEVDKLPHPGTTKIGLYYKDSLNQQVAMRFLKMLYRLIQAEQLVK